MASKDLKPGTRLRYRLGGQSVVTLERRKRAEDDHHGLPFNPGWWLADNRGGLADYVIDDEHSAWEVID